MATGSSLIKGVRRTGGRNKSQLEWSSTDSNINFSSKKGSNQGDSDSDFTSFTSSMHGSTSSATSSIDRYSSGMEGRTQRKKTLDKSNSKKRWSFRLSKRSPQSPSLSLPDDRSATTHHPSPVKVSDASPVQKPVLKISRSGSLRSLKIVRSKSKSSSESKGLTADDLRSNRATFSSTLKDSKFPEQVEPQVGIKESEQILPVAQLCPYQHCSLHGHHHHHEPPVKRFSFLKRRSSKDQKGITPKTPATIDKPSGKKPEVKPNPASDDLSGTEKGNPDGWSHIKKAILLRRFITELEKVKNFDPNKNTLLPSMPTSEAETVSLRPQTVVDKKNSDNWMLDYALQKLLCDGDDEQEVKDENLNTEFSSRDADILIRQSVKEILLPEVQEDASLEGKEVSGGESQKQEIPKNWNKLKTLRRSIKDLESSRKLIKQETPRKSVFQKEEEGEQVDLRRQMSRQKTKAEQWMIDYAVQHIVTKLTPARKKRVSMLVEAFEAVIPLPET
ncbi:hypothetical protein L1887_12778 [Cichorium endivia]|nr:hypothetical protein L1887_12778 [Cichorium endivia]